MAGKKPNDFDIRPALDGTEELYTQRDDMPEKFTLDQVKEFVFTNEIYNLSGDVEDTRDDIVVLSGEVVILQVEDIKHQNRIAILSGDVMTLSGDVMTLSGDVMTLSGDVVTISGDVVAITKEISINEFFSVEDIFVRSGLSFANVADSQVGDLATAYYIAVDTPDTSTVDYTVNIGGFSDSDTLGASTKSKSKTFAPVTLALDDKISIDVTSLGVGTAPKGLFLTVITKKP